MVTVPPNFSTLADACVPVGTTVTPDPHRGKVSLVSSEDGLLHFQWTQRPGGRLEQSNDLILFPGDTWTRVEECKTGRVYLLKCGASGSGSSGMRKRMFWLQEEKDDKDDEIAATLNRLIAQRPVASGGVGDLSDMDTSGLGSSGVEQEAILRFLQAQGATTTATPSHSQAQTTEERMTQVSYSSSSEANPSVTASSTSSSASSAAQSSASSSSSLSSSSAAPRGGTRSAGPAPGSSSSGANPAMLALLQQLLQSSAGTAPTLSLTSVLEAERVIPLMEQRILDSLYPYLPESQRTPEAVREQLRSPQFHQTLGRMSSVLNGAQFSAVMTSLGLPVGQDFGVLAFLNSIQARADADSSASTNSGSSSSSSSGSSSPKQL